MPLPPDKNEHVHTFLKTVKKCKVDLRVKAESYDISDIVSLIARIFCEERNKDGQHYSLTFPEKIFENLESNHSPKQKSYRVSNYSLGVFVDSRTYIPLSDDVKQAKRSWFPISSVLYGEATSTMIMTIDHDMKDKNISKITIAFTEKDSSKVKIELQGKSLARCITANVNSNTVDVYFHTYYPPQLYRAGSKSAGLIRDSEREENWERC